MRDLQIATDNDILDLTDDHERALNDAVERKVLKQLSPSDKIHQAVQERRSPTARPLAIQVDNKLVFHLGEKIGIPIVCKVDPVIGCSELDRYSNAAWNWDVKRYVEQHGAAGAWCEGDILNWFVPPLIVNKLRVKGVVSRSNLVSTGLGQALSARFGQASSFNNDTGQISWVVS